MATKRKPRAKKAEAGSRGIAAADTAGKPPAAIEKLQQQVTDDGGNVLAAYREPLGGQWLLLAALPVDKVQPTPYQRDLSAAHLKRMMNVLDKLGLYLDPIIATREGDGVYWTPNGNHRLAALRQLGGRAIMALLVPDPSVAFQILALNTEKAHNLKDKALEVIRMARAMAELGKQSESEYALQFEEPVLLTLGPCYEQNGRFSGGAYRPALVRVEAFLEQPLEKALKVREKRAELLLALDQKVTAVIAALKQKGIQSPYLRAFVTARINPIRFAKTVDMTPEELLQKMTAAAGKFDVGKVRQDQIQAGGGPAEEAEE
jgi:ParB family transcriptional regulator, chromosome partitioning protein